MVVGDIQKSNWEAEVEVEVEVEHVNGVGLAEEVVGGGVRVAVVGEVAPTERRSWSMVPDLEFPSKHEKHGETLGGLGKQVADVHFGWVAE